MNRFGGLPRSKGECLRRLQASFIAAAMLFGASAPMSAQRDRGNSAYYQGMNDRVRRGDYDRYSRDDERRHDHDKGGGIGPGKGALIGGGGGAALGAIFGGGLKGALIGGAAGAGIGAIGGKLAQGNDDHRDRNRHR
jgi:hypothetical protein